MENKFSGSRMNRQTKNKTIAQAQPEVELRKTKVDEARVEVEGAKDALDSKKYWADKNEKYLERMRDGYAEGTKLYYDSFKTRATLTTASIVVILALYRGVLPTDAAYGPILWVSIGLLLFSMVATLRTMDGITINVFDTLTKEDAPTSISDGTAERKEADHLKEERRKSNKRLALRTRLASGSFLLGIGAFAVYASLPLLVGLVGLTWALAILAVMVVAAVLLYRKF